MFGSGKKSVMPGKDEALPGRERAMIVARPHSVLGTSLTEYPPGTERALFGMGCFWGAERVFWQQAGVFSTAVGYGAGYTPNPTYEEVCTGMTGHNEVVQVVFYPEKTSYQSLLEVFWQNHNPTQGMRQANDIGTQYRSGIYYFNESQKTQAQASLSHYSAQLERSGSPAVTTEILPAEPFYFAESYHQQYLAKNPGGYCNLQSIGKTGLPEY